jgi:hypothetical protein
MTGSSSTAADSSPTALDRIRVRSLVGWVGAGFAAGVLASILLGPVPGLGPADRVAETAGPALVGLAALGWLVRAVWAKGLSPSALFGPAPSRAGWGWVLAAILAMDLFQSAQIHLLVPWLERAAPALADWYMASSTGDPGGTAAYAGMVLRAVVVASLLEEVLFRGLLYQRWARSWNRPVAALLASSLLFAALHGHVIGAFVMAVVATLLFLITRSLWAPIAFHAGGNALSIPGMPSLEEGYAALTHGPADAAFGALCLTASLPFLAWFVWRHRPALRQPLPYLQQRSSGMQARER